MSKLQFNKALFWDIDPNNLDKNKHSKYIIRRVLQYGSLEDWNKLKMIYGLSMIVKKAQTIKEIDKKTASFLSIIGNVPRKKFACYTNLQSIPKHWNF